MPNFERILANHRRLTNLLYISHVVLFPNAKRGKLKGDFGRKLGQISDYLIPVNFMGEIGEMSKCFSFVRDLGPAAGIFLTAEEWRGVARGARTSGRSEIG